MVSGPVEGRHPLRRVTTLVSALLAGALVLTACGGDDDPTTPPPRSAAPTSDVKVGLAYDIGGRGDKSFNDSAAAGLDKAKAELNVEAKEPEAEHRRGRDRQGGAPAACSPRPATTRSSRSASPTRSRWPRSRRGATRTSKFAIVDDARARGPERRQPRLRRGAGLVPRRRGGRAEVQDRARSASSAASRPPLIKKFEAGFTAGVEGGQPGHQGRRQVPHPAAGLLGLQRPGQGQDRRRGHVRRAAPTSSTRRPVARVPACSRRPPRPTASARSASTPTSTTRLTPTVQDVILTSMLKQVDVAVFDFIKAVDDDTFKAGVTVFDLKDGRRRLLDHRRQDRRHQGQARRLQGSRSSPGRSRSRRRRD